MSRILFFLIAFLFLLSCASNAKKETEEQVETTDCPAFVNVGKVKICLPEIDSMVESYTDSLVKVWADNHEFQGNTVLSFYLRNPTVFAAAASGEKVYDDFFKIFQINSLRDLDVDKKYMDEVAFSITNGREMGNWGEVLKKLEKDYTFLPSDKPYFIDQYSPHPDVRSFVILYRYKEEKVDIVLMGVMNMLLIKKRMIGLTYYKAFMGPETLSKARTKNDAIVAKVMAVNE